MKSLKFAPELCIQILTGTKTSTWRLFDDKNLQIGDEFECVNKETYIPFGTAIITELVIKTFDTLEEMDFTGHRRYASEEEMYQDFRKYYGDTIGPDTELKILQFSFTPST